MLDLHRGRRNQLLRQALLGKLPCLLRERELPCRRWQKYDKAFACAWLDHEYVVVGTKCNKLLLANILTCELREVAPPPAPLRQPRSSEAPVEGQGFGNCGIHAVALNPDAQLLATGGANPNDCQVHRVRLVGQSNGGAPALAPVQTLVGHDDWVFGIAWITERHLVTGSRDRTVRLWCTDADSGRPNTQPLVTQHEKRDKVRDVQYNQTLGRIASLVTSGSVHLWDPHLRLARTVKLTVEREVVCMAMSDGLVAVGSQSHVSLVDPRCQAPVQDVASLDTDHGVRSLCFLDHLLSCGTGRGRVSFYDLRASAWMDLDPEPDAPQRASGCGGGARRSRGFQQLGPGWLCQTDPVYMEHFMGQEVFNACYAHAWDPTCTKLLCVGGPLAYGLRGSYMALWE
ncbi:hypothetical protein WJX81_001747 [Elliptochloris bilobata]|uniref:DDB1- and CUL4-associated factor 12 beta-propeller domain-containing protein n=1 Tax=Elliptochloris bilobata TaxID=381761 RepID=A0AAW1R197_9CHLO